MTELISQGELAELGLLRVTQTETQKVAIQQLLAQHEERILCHTMQVTATLSNAFQDRDGYVMITSDRVLFWSQEAQHQADDLAIHATAIDLHALAREPTSCYIQLQSDSESGPLELTIVPTGSSNSFTETQAQALYEALSELISLHPIDPNDEDDDEYDFVEDNGDDEMIFWAPSEEEATPDKREAMLERLDNLLVVPPELEKSDDEQQVPRQSGEGQFDDAEDDPLL